MKYGFFKFDKKGNAVHVFSFTTDSKSSLNKLINNYDLHHLTCVNES